MRIFALCSWYDEAPEHLERLVQSLDGFADVLVGVDGAYSTFPGAKRESPAVQHWALLDAVRASRLAPHLVTPRIIFEGEVAKRARMFEIARQAGATAEDWLLIMDADMALGHHTAEARELLEHTDRDVAEVRWHNVQVDGKVNAEYRFRSLFRALPGLTVERTHWLYTVPDDTQPLGRRFLWHTPDGRISEEPELDLFGHVTLQHFNSQRDPARKQRALAYYQDRDGRTLESAGDWR